MIQSCSMDHPNLVVVHFNACSGGKFFINCLAHHTGILPPMGDVDDIENRWISADISDALKYRLKLELINRSLPAKEHMLDWIKYERGDTEMWNGNMTMFLDTNNNICVSDQALELLDQYVCFIINHNINQKTITDIQKLWPSARHIGLCNASRFQQLSAKLKNYPTEILNNVDITKLDQFTGGDAYYVNVDDTWFDVNKTVTVVDNCITWLGLNNEPMPALYDYITRYFELHR